MNKKGSAHLTRECRRAIRDSLGEGMRLKEIAAIVGKDERTVSKEIMEHRVPKSNGRVAFAYDKSAECQRLKRFPGVCNGCGKRRNCLFAKQFVYDPDVAHEAYRSLLSSCREGYAMNEEGKAAFDAAMKNGVGKGQSPYHIVKTNPDAIKCSLRTAYRIIDNGDSPVKNIDLRRKVKLKPRRRYRQRNKDRLEVRKGREYPDFVADFTSKGAMGVVELDTVEGPVGGSGKCFLTIHSTITHLMIIRVLDSKSKEEVNKAIEGIKSDVGEEAFARFFAMTLTDRGCEFVDPTAIEVVGGEKRCSLYYCDSYSSYQKGAEEENHTIFRYALPKGTDFRPFGEKDARLLMSHINSYERKSIGTTPYKLAMAIFGKGFLDALGISYVEPSEVNLTPALFKAE